MQYIYSVMQLYNTLSKKERAELIKISKRHGLHLPSVIHPSSVVLKKSKLGAGVVIEPLVFVGYNANIEDVGFLQERISGEQGC